VRSFGGRASQFQRVRRVKPPRAPAATFPATVYEWTDLGARNEISGAFVVAIGDVVYFIEAQNDFESYDTGTATFTQLSAPPHQQNVANGLGVNGSTLVLFTTTGIGDPGLTPYTEEYTPGTDTWDSGVVLTPMPLPRLANGFAQVGGNCYFIAGIDGAAVAQNDLQIYDLAGDSWSTGADCPFSGANIYAMCAAAGTKIYCWDGTGGSSYAYNTSGNSWAAISALPGAISFPQSAVAINATTIFVGDGTNNYVYSTTGDSFTPVTATPASGVPGSGVTIGAATYFADYGPGSHAWRFEPA